MLSRKVLMCVVMGIVESGEGVNGVVVGGCVIFLVWVFLMWENWWMWCGVWVL